MRIFKFIQLLQNINNNKKNANEIDNVLLHLRHYSLKNQNRSDFRKSILLASPFIWVINLLLIPLLVVGKFKSLILSALLACIPFLIFEIINFKQYVLLTAIIWALTNIKSFCETLINFCFDFFDFVFLGKFTKKFP